MEEPLIAYYLGFALIDFEKRDLFRKYLLKRVNKNEIEYVKNVQKLQVASYTLLGVYILISIIITLVISIVCIGFKHSSFYFLFIFFGLIIYYIKSFSITNNNFSTFYSESYMNLENETVYKNENKKRLQESRTPSLILVDDELKKISLKYVFIICYFLNTANEKTPIAINLYMSSYEEIIAHLKKYFGIGRKQETIKKLLSKNEKGETNFLQINFKNRKKKSNATNYDFVCSFFQENKFFKAKAKFEEFYNQKLNN